MGKDKVQKLDGDLEKVSGGWSWFKPENPNLSSEDKKKMKAMMKEYDALAKEYGKIHKDGDMTDEEYIDRINRVTNGKKTLESQLYI